MNTWLIDTALFKSLAPGGPKGATLRSWIETREDPLFLSAASLVELKAVKTIAPEHQAQIINYLIATHIDVGLLINFGNPKLEYKRFTRSQNGETEFKHG